MKYSLHTLFAMLFMVGCNSISSNDTVIFRAMVTNIIDYPTVWSMSNGDFEWSESHYTVEFLIKAPLEWAGSNVVVCVSPDVKFEIFGNSTGKTFELEIASKHLNQPAGFELHDDMLYRLKKIE